MVSLTFMATQSMPTVSHLSMALAMSSLVPTPSVHRVRAISPKSMRPVNCPGRSIILTLSARRKVSRLTRASMARDLASMFTPAWA